MLFAGLDDTSDLPFVRVAGVTQKVTLEVHSSYGDDATAADQLGIALGRMSENRPLWQQPAGIVVTALVALGAVIALTRTRGRAAFVLLVLFVVAKGLLWTAIIPPFQSPDEPGHFAYAQFMAESHGIPIRDNTRFGDTNLTSEEVRSLGVAMHINAYAFGDRSDYGPAGREQFDALAGLSGVDDDPHGNGPAAGYTPVYYAPAAALYALWNARVDQRVQIVRWWSIALGVVLALAVFAIGRRLFPGSEAVAIALAVAVSAQPMISQQSAVVNNDAMVIACGAVCLLLALDLLRAVPERGRRLAFWSAFALGLTVLAKSFGVVLVPVVFLGWLVGRMRTQKADRPPLIREALGAAAGLAVTYGAWAIIARSIGFKSATLGDFSSDGLAHPLSGYLRLLKHDSFQFIRANLVDQLWGVFGWLRAPLPRWILTSIGWLTLVVGVIAIVWVVRGLLDALRRVRTRDWAGFDLDGTTVGAMLLGTIVGTVVLLYAIEFTIYRINGDYVLQGRYFLVMLPALLLLPVMAVPRLVPRLSATVVSTAIAVGMVALNVISVAVIVEHFYL
jgi:4-amino-4-deoxy-L-arabinose transferase-like glycosyltransferase